MPDVKVLNGRVPTFPFAFFCPKPEAANVFPPSGMTSYAKTRDQKELTCLKENMLYYFRDLDEYALYILFKEGTNHVPEKRANAANYLRSYEP